MVRLKLGVHSKPEVEGWRSVQVPDSKCGEKAASFAITPRTSRALSGRSGKQCDHPLGWKRQLSGCRLGSTGWTLVHHHESLHQVK